jgi:hypothetical protein
MSKFWKALIARCELRLRVSAQSCQIAASGPLALLTVIILAAMWLLR